MTSRARARAWIGIGAATMLTLTASCLFPSLSDLTTCAHGCGGGTSASSTSATTASMTAASSSSSSSGGGASASSSTGAGGATSCALGANQHGPTGVHVDPGGGFPSYCIDATEVSVAEFKEFYTGNNFPVKSALVPPQCAWKDVTTNAAFTPEGTGNDPYIWNHYKGGLEPDRPIQGLDWCDAAIYCKWAGKRLCGASQAGGGRIDTSKNPQWMQSGEWFRACQGPHQYAFGYGPSGVAGTCNLDKGPADAGDPDPFKTTDVTLPASCVTSWPGGDLHDMIGNVLEFEDDCDDQGAGGPMDRCYMRGGTYAFGYDYTSCDFLQAAMMTKRGTKGEYQGVRCCW